MNILIALESFDCGGVESRTLTFSRNLIQRGHKVSVVSNGGSLVPLLKEFCGKHYLVDFSDVANSSLIVKKLESIIDREEIDIVDVHPYFPVVNAFLACWIKKKPIILTVHSSKPFSEWWEGQTF